MSVRPFKNIFPTIHNSAYIDEAAVVIGDVTIGEDCSIWPMVVVRGDVHKITIGKRTNVQDGSVLHVTANNQFNPGGHALIVGEDVTVGHGAILHACTIGNFCLIGMGATILDGAVIEDEVIVAAGSVVTPGKKLESGFMYMGSPAKQARPLRDKEREYLHFSSQHYINLKNEYLS